MFIADQTFMFKYERFELQNLVIDKATIDSFFEIGGNARCFEPDNTTYEAFPITSYSYDYDYVTLLIDKCVQGYFIGEVGMNIEDTPLSNSNDWVYALYEIWINIGYDDGEEPEMFIFLFEYLLRHCKNNGCKLLLIMKDKENRYAHFYDYVKKRFGMQEYKNYLIKAI